MNKSYKQLDTYKQLINQNIGNDHNIYNDEVRAEEIADQIIEEDTRTDMVLYDITRKPVQCIGWDVSVDEDGIIFQVDCSCNICKNAKKYEVHQSQQLGSTWKEFTSKQVERFRTGDLS